MTQVWIRKCDSFEEEARADREFWARLAPAERVAALEELRLPPNDVAERGVSRDLEELIAALRGREARFVVVGAHAVAFHAKPRYTKALDIFLEPTRENALRVVAALDDFGFGALGLDASDFTTAGRIVQLGRPPNRVDLLTSITGVSFEEAWASRVAGAYGAEAVDFLGRLELIRNKRAAGRPQDRLDVSWLEGSDDSA